MDLSQIFQVLTQADKQAQATNPYSGFGNISDQIGQLIVKSAGQRDESGNSRYGFGEILGAGLVDGLMGGVAQHYGNEYQADQNRMAQDTLFNIWGGKNVQRPDGMNPNVWSTVDNAGKLFGAQRMLDVADDQRKADLQFENQRRLKTLDRDFDLEKIREKQKMDLQRFGMATGTGAMPGAQPLIEERLGPNLGIPSVSDLEHEYFKRNVLSGMPEIQAATSAKAQAQDIRQRSRDLFGKSLGEEAESISQMEDFIRKGEQGIAQAGMTGSKLASTWEKGLAMLGFDEAEKQAAGDSLLSQTQNLGVAINRVKGTGALSDFESKQLFATAMSPSNAKPQNEIILEQYKNGLAIAKEHQSFMNYVMGDTPGDPNKAQALWDLYKQANPLLVPDGQGGYEINRTRTPWQKFDFGEAYKQAMSGAPLQSMMQEEGQAPPAAPPGYINTGRKNPQTGKWILRAQ